MSQFFIQTPVWVWPLFVVLLVVGLRATRDRRAPLLLLYALPLLGVMGLRTVLGLAGGAGLLALFAVVYLGGATLGYRLQARWTGARQGALVQLRGEWVTLVAMMTLFFANFVLGVLTDVAPQLLTGLAFQSLFTVVLAAASGSFAGRAVQVWHAGRGQQDG